MSEESKIYYKGFDKDLKCRGFQYEIGKTYEEPEAVLCECGFHACESPLDVLHYYPPATSRYCEVQMDGVSDTQDHEDSKRVAKKITIGAEIGIPGLVKAHVEWVKEQLAPNKQESSTGYQAASTSTGDQAASTSTGDRAASTSTGYRAASTSTGDQAASTSTGYQAASTSTGYQAASAVNEGGSVALTTGIHGKAKAGIGSAIVIVERGDYNGSYYPIKNIRAAVIDGEKLKPDTWYTLKSGAFVEVDDDDA